MPTEITIASRKEAIAHEIDEHDEFQPLIRVLAKRLGITYEVLRQELIDEIDLMPKRFTK